MTPAERARPMSPLQQWEALYKSDAFQAGLRAPKPEMTAAMARQIAPLLRPGLRALEELGEPRRPADWPTGADAGDGQRMSST
jgi:hypothetical protein